MDKEIFSLIRLATINFRFDFVKKNFKAINLKLYIDIHPELSLEQKKVKVINDFKQIEAYFDKLLFPNKGLRKKAGGSEHTSYLTSGYIYSTIGYLNQIYYELSYSLYFKNNDIENPEIDIFLNSPWNTNYFALIDIIYFFEFSVPIDSMNTLKRMQSRLDNTKQNFSPEVVLEHIASEKEETETPMEMLYENNEDAILKNIIEKNKTSIQKLKKTLSKAVKINILKLISPWIIPITILLATSIFILSFKK